jgi:hypothetical protein
MLELLGHSEAASALRDLRRQGGSPPKLFGGETIYSHSRRWGLDLDVPEVAMAGWASYEK